MNENERIKEGVAAAVKALDDKFGKDIAVLNISEISCISDYFIISHGSNINQIKAMADEVEKELHLAGFPLNHSEGKSAGSWILLDFGSIIVHIFDEESRYFFDLERIWGDAKNVTSQFAIGRP